MAPMRPLFYDKDGKPVSLKQWAKLIEDPTYRRVAETILPDGTWISTVLLGLDHRFTMEGPPVIFETMVFPDAENLRERDCERYATQEEAIAGHATMVQKWSPGEKVRGPMRITKIGAQAYEVTGHNPRNLTEKVVVTVWGAPTAKVPTVLLWTARDGSFCDKPVKRMRLLKRITKEAVKQGVKIPWAKL